MIQYHKAGESSTLVGTSKGGYQSEDTVVIEVDGKRYRKVQIEDSNDEYLMDEENNIYDMELNKIGQAGDSDED